MDSTTFTRCARSLKRVRLSAALAPGVRLTVVGAGFIGQEVAATARSLGVEVTIVEAAGAPLVAILGEGARLLVRRPPSRGGRAGPALDNRARNFTAVTPSRRSSSGTVDACHATWSW